MVTALLWSGCKSSLGGPGRREERRAARKRDQQRVGWVATIVIAGLTSAAFTAQGVYAPNRGDSIRYGQVIFAAADAAEAAEAAAANATAALAPAPAP